MLYKDRIKLKDKDIKGFKEKIGRQEQRYNVKKKEVEKLKQRYELFMKGEDKEIEYVKAVCKMRKGLHGNIIRAQVRQ